MAEYRWRAKPFRLEKLFQQSACCPGKAGLTDKVEFVEGGVAFDHACDVRFRLLILLLPQG